MNKAKIIAAIVEKFNIKLDKDDPAFVLVEMNKLALKETVTEVVGQFDDLLSRLDAAEGAGHSSMVVIGVSAMVGVMASIVTAVIILLIAPSPASNITEQSVKRGNALTRIYPRLDSVLKAEVDQIIK